MIDFSKPVRFRGKHAGYAQYLCTERGQKREGGANVFSRVMDVYLVSILVGVKYNKTALIDDSEIDATSVFGNLKEYLGKKISSSDINSETVHASQDLLNYIYRIVMLNSKDKITDEERIANAFKSDGNEEKISRNFELLNSYSRGGLEILYDRFKSCNGDEDEIIRNQLALYDELSGFDLEMFEE